MRYWLMKTEPTSYSIDDLAREGATSWTGVRNYQARNFMRDDMKVGDGVLFYHSSCPEPGIVGLAEVSDAAHPDPTQFDARSKYFDPASRPDAPRWVNVEIKLVRRTRLLPLEELRAYPELAAMPLLQRGNRLSITPVTAAEWRFLQKKLK
ncbi:MAG: EVE domain-containing protein [Firmicutes bacterium]|nr:EVE domain-containing protein [Bacillota bacterium]